MYPVLEIIHQMSQGRRSKQTAEERIRSLQGRQANDFSDEDGTHVHKAVGPWIMANAEK